METKIRITGILSILSVLIINSILIVSYINLFLKHHFNSIMTMDINLWFVFVTFLIIASLVNTAKVPFHSYPEEDESEEDVEQLFLDETSDITTHIGVTTVITAILVILMYVTTL